MVDRMAVSIGTHAWPWAFLLLSANGKFVKETPTGNEVVGENPTTVGLETQVRRGESSRSEDVGLKITCLYES